MSVNPFIRLPIYSANILKQYIGQRLGALPPHIFATANAAYSNMMTFKKNQSVVIRYQKTSLQWMKISIELITSK